jgi:hypothetical protein
MKIRYIILLLLLQACANNAGSATAGDNSACLFDFGSQPICVHGNMKIAVKTAKIASDEIRLVSLEVERSGKIQSLPISEDTTLLRGDQGFIAFEDINFDKIPDISISTSFGVANQYFDYWVFDPGKKKFSFIGNHCKFSIDSESRTLSNTIKINSATYVKNKYFWNGLKLLKAENKKQ